MHELSIAESILGIVRQYVPPDDEKRVKAINVRVGELSGVVADSLEFCFGAITAETSLHRAALCIERIPFQLYCENCADTKTSSRGLAVCPDCGGAQTKILSGNELQVTDIEMDD